MKKTILKVLATVAEKSIKKSNNSTCFGWTYQPKAPDNILEFKKNK